MISDEEALHGLTSAIDLMNDKEYRGARKLIMTIRNKLQKKVDEQKRLERKKIAQAEQIIRDKNKNSE